MDITQPFTTIARSKKRMIDLDKHTPPTRKKVLRYLLILVVLGLAVNLLLPKIADLRTSWEIVQGMIWWAVGLAFFCQILVFVGYGYCLHSILAIRDFRLKVGKGALIAMASISIGLVAGGWVASVAAMFGFIRKENTDRATATMAGIMPTLLINGSIELVSIIGIIYLLIVDKITPSQLLRYSVFILLLSIVTFGSLLTLRFPKASYSVVNWVMSRWAKLRKKPHDPMKTQEMLNNYIDSWKAIGKGQWQKPFLGAMMYIVFNMLCMYFLFIASGHNVNLGVLFAGFGLPLLLAKMAFLFPGGIGIIEASMAALFTSLGVPEDISVVVIIGYRLLSFWIPTLLGFGAAGFLSRGGSTPVLTNKQVI